MKSISIICQRFSSKSPLISKYLLFYIIGIQYILSSEITAQTIVYNNPPYTVSNLAGSVVNGTGFNDGISANAIFSQPIGIALDTSGNLYIADSTNYVIRKLDTSGIVTTIAGQQSILGNRDGTGSTALFGVVSGLTIDSTGTLYVTDLSYNTVRKISPSGSTWITSTLIPASAGLNKPNYITIDKYNNLYVSDTKNYVIRKITPSGNMVTLAGTLGTPGGIDGIGTAASFGSPEGIAVDSNGNIYVADSSNSTIRKITSTGKVSTIGGFWGAPGFYDGQLTTSQSQFSHPYALCIDNSDNLFISDQFNETVLREISSTGIVSTVAGKTISGSRDGDASVATFDMVQGLTINNLGNIYIAATGSSTIRLATQTSNSVILPVVIIQPQSQSISLGSSATFNVTAQGSSLSYQWCLNGNAILGATASNYIITNATNQIAGSYSVVITNSAGSVTSQIAKLSIASSMAIIQQPASQTINLGDSLTLSISVASSNSPVYQWYFNNRLIVDAKSSTYTIPSANTLNAGFYTASVTDSYGTITSQAAQVIVNTPGRLINLSILSLDGPGSQLLTVGFVSGGAGTVGSQNFLIRGSGPAIGLAPFNVSNVLPDPVLTVYNNSALAIAYNDNWGTPVNNSTAVIAAAVETGAFALTNTASLDSAIATSLTAGGYSVQVAGKNVAVGNVLAEIYDNTPTNSYTLTTPRLVNLSCLEQVATGGILSAGFVIAGNTSIQVLIRASGPTLTAPPFNLAGTIPDPKITVYDSSSAQIATNTGWSGNATIALANNSAGAFQFVSNSSKDSAVLLTLQPGAYTVQVSSPSGSAGITLIEVYEVKK